MSPRGVRHTSAKYRNICRICGQEFASKKPSTMVCYEAPCQRAYDAERYRKRYEKKKQQADQPTP